MSPEKREKIQLALTACEIINNNTINLLVDNKIIKAYENVILLHKNIQEIKTQLQLL